MGGLRYFVGAVAFGFAALWIMATLAGALVCALSAVVGYGVVVAAERMQAKLGNRANRSGVSDARNLPVWADALNTDLGHIYEPSATSPLSREDEYGWPQADDTAITSGALS